MISAKTRKLLSGAAAAAVVLGFGFAHAQQGPRGKSSYMEVEINEPFSAVFARLSGQKAEVTREPDSSRQAWPTPFELRRTPLEVNRGAQYPLCADRIEKVFFACRRKFSMTADAFVRGERPHQFTQNSPETFITAGMKAPSI